MKDTITESELADVTLDFISRHQDVSARSAMRNTLAQLGITVVPDPIPEPEGDVIVVDRDGCRWTKDHGPQMWTTSTRDSVLVRDWRDLAKLGPVKVYRLEGEAK